MQNKTIKILTVLGTRPEAIKLAPLLLELGSSPYFESVICSTGQHSEMLDQALRVFNLKPDLNLGLMKKSQTLAGLNSRALEKCSAVIRKVNPDLVVVHGDTTTAQAAAIASFYAGVPVAHVEAGLRTWDMHSPFPEEFNRQVISKIASLNFTPTPQASSNLRREGVSETKIIETGNTVVDALESVIRRFEADSVFNDTVVSTIEKIVPGYSQSTELIYVTAHRRESLDGGIESICKAIRGLSEVHPQIKFVFPVHLNPAVQVVANRVLSSAKNVILTAPLAYEVAVKLMNQAILIISDSGGIQEEGAALGKIVLVTRDKTERAEGVISGHLRLCGTDENMIRQEFEASLGLIKAGETALGLNPYGDGQSTKRIISHIQSVFADPQIRKTSR